MIDFLWESSDSIILLNPCHSKQDKSRFSSLLDYSSELPLPGHIWLSTSGSTVQKWVGLSKKAVLASAKAVNEHLSSNSSDCWVNALPYFHAGGLGVFARASLSGAKVCDFTESYMQKWNAAAFYDFIEQKKGSLTALVPAQLHDLIKLDKMAPSELRAVVIGGGELLPDLYEKAVESGWPILPSYGLTECASQVATANLESWKSGKYPNLRLLNHIQARIQESRLSFSGSSLLSTYAFFEGGKIKFIDPKVDGWFVSEDYGSVDQGSVAITGRVNSMIKIGGENVDLYCLEKFLQILGRQLSIQTHVVLFGMPDDRLGHCIHLAAECLEDDSISGLAETFNLKVLPFERIRKVHCISPLPRSPLGKVLIPKLIKLINLSK